MIVMLHNNSYSESTLLFSQTIVFMAVNTVLQMVQTAGIIKVELK